MTARIGRLAGESFDATYAAFGIEASGLAGEAIRCLRRGDRAGAEAAPAILDLIADLRAERPA